MKTTSWQRKPGGRTGGVRGRWWRRVLMTVVVLALLSTFAYALFAPFWHPRTHLVLLTGGLVEGEEQVLGAPPVEYVIEDFSEFFALENVLYQGLLNKGPHIMGSLRSRSDMRNFGQQLAELPLGQSDVLILYVSAHGVSDDGTAYLLCSDNDPANPQVGRYRLRNLLQQVSSINAATKLVIIDAGRIDYDPARGMVNNSFTRLLREDLEALDDPALCVLCSHHEGERSHVSHALQRSVFGYFVARGLAGAGDLNEDRVVDLAELHRYVAVNVSEWVRQATIGRATQTPMLARSRAAARRPAERTALIAVIPPKTPEEVPDHRQAIEEAQARSNNPNALAQSGRGAVASYINRAIMSAAPAGRFGRQLTDMATSRVDQVAGARGGGGGAEDAAGGTAAGGTAPGASGGDAASDANGSAGSGGDASAAGDGATDSNANGAGGAAGANGAAANGGATEESAADGTAKESDAATTAPASGNGGRGATNATSGADDDPRALAATRQETERLLAQAWQLRDELDDPARAGPRPVDEAPHWWRCLGEQLLMYERRHRLSAPSRQLQTALASIVQQLTALSEGQLPDNSRQPTLARRIAESMPAQACQLNEPHSLAMAEMEAARRGTAVRPEILAVRQTIDKFLSQGLQKEFTEAISNLTPSQQQLVEVRLAQQLVAAPHIEVDTIQMAIALRCLAEQVAAQSLRAVAWVQQPLAELDRRRLAVERQMLEGIHYDKSQIDQALNQLHSDYQQILDQLNMLRDARRLGNDLLLRAPYYIRWHRAAAGESGLGGPSTIDLTNLLEQMLALTSLLEQPSPDNLAQVEQLARQLTALRQQVESGASADSIELLTTPPAEPGDAHRIETLLQTPIPTAEHRAALLAAVNSVDATMALQFQLPEASRALLPAHALPTPYWEAVRDTINLEWARVRLSARNLSPESPDLSAIAAARMDALAHIETLLGDVEASKLQHAASQAIDAFGAALASHYRNLPGRIERALATAGDLADSARRPEQLLELQARNRALRQVDARDALAMTPPAPAELLQRVACYDLLLLQRARCLQARREASLGGGTYWTNMANAYVNAANAIPLQPLQPPDPGPRTSLEAPASISLSIDDEQDVQVEVRYRGAEETPGWVIVDYDPQLLQVISTLSPLYNRDQVNDWSTRGDMPEATVILKPGRPLTLRFVVRRRQGARYATSFVVGLRTAAGESQSAIAVNLPAPAWARIAASGLAGSWTPSARGGVTLHPLPNRTSRYQVQLASSVDRQCTVDVQLFPLTEPLSRNVPGDSLTADDAAVVLRNLPLGPALAQAQGIVLPANGRVDFPFPATAAAPADGAAAPPPLDISAGLLAVVQDTQRQQVLLQTIELSPQRPSRYVQPRVAYDPVLERILIDVKPIDPAMLPPDGVRVRAEVVNGLREDAERRLDSVLQPPAFDAQLYAQMAPEVGKQVLLHIHVDDYPRAFVYRVPCNAEVFDVPPAADLVALEITDLPDGLLYPAPAGTIPVILGVDVPAGALNDGQGYIEVGLDRNRDRDFLGEATQRIALERQAQVQLKSLGARGLLEVDTRVSDLRVELVDSSRQSGRVNVLARVFATGEMVWSSSREIVLDGTPPQLSDVHLRPDRVVASGQEIIASVIADDEALSGVVKVEAAIDVTRSGKFPTDQEPVLATLGDDGRWSAKLPTKGLAPGGYNLLLRGTDQMGNVSQPLRVRMQIGPVEQSADEAKLAQISGTVVFGRQPQARMTVELRQQPTTPPPPGAEPPKPLAITTTDEQGRFTFADVAAGKYVVHASGVVRNKPRRAEAEVTAEPPQPVQPVQLKLP